MVLELALVEIIPGHEADFVADLDRAVSEVLVQASGFLAFSAHGWSAERPGTFMFTIEWQALDDHLIGFRESERFGAWRALIGPHFASSPVIEHFEIG